MSNNMEIDTIATEPSDAVQQPKNGFRSNKRQGRGAKARSTNKYRMRINQQSTKALHQQINERLKLTESPEMERVKDVVERIRLVVQPQAIPLSITTRGIGFNVALFYDRAVTTWNLQQISSIATIHQVYRVCLYLSYYKAYLAQQCQVELSTDYEALYRFDLSDRIREILNAVTVIPTSVALVINNIGRIKTKEATYHMGFAIPPEDEEDLLTYRIVALHPGNIVGTLAYLTNNNTDQEDVDRYLNYNSIPGLAIQNGRPVNTDEVWPADYGANTLSQDVAAFNHLMTRVQGRLPRHTFYEMSWSGEADAAGLWSSELVGAKLSSQLLRAGGDVEPKKKRKATGSFTDCVLPAPLVYEYQQSILCDRNTEFWSREETSEGQAVVGTASMVGEACFIHSRYHLVCGHVTSVHPVQTLRSIISAPR